MTFHLCEFVFYFMTVVFLWYEFFCVNDAEFMLSLLNSFRTKKPSDFSDKENALVVIAFIYPIWGIIGLFSSQFILFGLLFVLSIIGTFVKRKHKELFVKWFKIDSIISIFLLILIVLNKFYFKILE